MEPILAYLLIAAVAGGLAIARANAGIDRWIDVGAQLDLHYRRLPRSMFGTVEGFAITIERQKQHIRIQLSAEKAIGTSLSLSRERFLAKVLGGRDIEVGCPTFDANMLISGDSHLADAEVAALFDEKTRAVVSRVVVRGGAEVSKGVITHAKTTSIDQAPKVIEDLLELARHLTLKSSEIPHRLAANALGDPLSSIRLHNLTLLQGYYPKSMAADSASRVSLTSPNHSIRLAAAMFLGPDGTPVIEELARSQWVETDVRTKALQLLTSRKNLEAVIELAPALLADRDARVRRMAIQSLGRLQHRASLPSIIALLDPEDVATSLEIAEALENIGDSSAEPVLIGLLEDAPNRVKSAAIEALAEIGTIAAVEPLHALTGQRGFKRSASVAIESIQSRLGDVEAGRLSLAPAVDPEGALSLAGDPEKAGGLSLDKGTDQP